MPDEIKKRFGDFAKEHRPLDGEKLSITDVFNKEITVLGYKLSGSKFHKTLPCLQLQFTMEGSRHVLFTSSTVIAEQVEAYKDEIPFLTTIRRVGKFYTFT